MGFPMQHRIHFNRYTVNMDLSKKYKDLRYRLHRLISFDTNIVKYVSTVLKDGKNETSTSEAYQNDGIDSIIKLLLGSDEYKVLDNIHKTEILDIVLNVTNIEIHQLKDSKNKGFKHREIISFDAEMFINGIQLKPAFIESIVWATEGDIVDEFDMCGTKENRRFVIYGV